MISLRLQTKIEQCRDAILTGKQSIHDAWEPMVIVRALLRMHRAMLADKETDKGYMSRYEQGLDLDLINSFKSRTDHTNAQLILRACNINLGTRNRYTK